MALGIEPALLGLLKLRARARFRRATRSMKSPKGAALTGLGVLMFVLWLGPSLYTRSFMDRPDPEVVRTFAPLITLMWCALSLFMGSTDRALYYAPAEVNFLFGGPFTRRSILIFKLLTTLNGTLMGAAIFSLFMWRYATTWLASFLAVFTAVWLIQLFTLMMAMGALLIKEKAFSLGRKIAFALVLIILATGLYASMPEGGNTSLTDYASRLREWLPMKILLLPFEPVGYIFTAATLLELLGWAGVAFAVNLAMLGVIIGLDAEYRDTAVSVSQRVYTRAARMRRGGFAGTSKTTANRRLPSFPHFMGAGPQVWRQLTTALRSSRAMLFMLFIMACASLPVLIMILRDGGDNELAGWALAPGLFWVTLILVAMLRFDFRGDIDNMENLKALPISPLALSFGQILTPVLVASVFEFLVVFAMAYVQRTWFIVPVALLLCPILNVMLFGLENLLYLLYPIRFTAATPGDFQHFGRQIASLFVRLLLIAFLLLICGASAVLAYFALGENIPAAIVAGALPAIAVDVGLIFLVSWAFKRFDVSKHMPD